MQFQIACQQNDALIHIQFRLSMIGLRRQKLSRLWLKASLQGRVGRTKILHKGKLGKIKANKILNCYTGKGGPGSVVCIATGYGLGSPGIESRWGARFSAPVQTGPWAHPTFCTMGTGSFPGVKSGRGVTLTPHPLLVPLSRKGRAIPLLPLWAVLPVQSLSACTRVRFTGVRNCLKQPHVKRAGVLYGNWKYRQKKKSKIVPHHHLFHLFSYCTLSTKSLDFYSVFPKDKIGLHNKQTECDHKSELYPALRTAYILSVLIED